MCQTHCCLCFPNGLGLVPREDERGPVGVGLSVWEGEREELRCVACVLGIWDEQTFECSSSWFNLFDGKGRRKIE